MTDLRCRTNPFLRLRTAPPSEAGIPEEAVLAFLDRLEASRLPMHALLLMRHGKLVTEGYYAPYEKDMLHRTFSVCKTLNALAVGLLESEGLLRLEDRITQYFPDKVPDNAHPFITAMTIRDLLMMRTCHASTTYKYDRHAEWVESFFHVPPTHKPGTVFHYDTSAAHVLCQLVQRVSGQPMLEYLKDRALRRIGWSEESYVILNEYGDPHGGSGLMCTARDLLLLGQLLLQQGSWEGEQLLPREFVVTATSNLTPTLATGPIPSEMQGYGYQIWRNERNGFVCYGMGGQLAICLPDYDLICVTCADTQGMGGGNQFIYNAFYDTILPGIDGAVRTAASKNAEAASQLVERLKNLIIHPVETGAGITSEATMTAIVNNVTYQLSDNPAGFTTLCLRFEESGQRGVLSYRYGGHDCKLSFGIGECLTGEFPVYGYYCATSGAWIDRDTFYIKSHILDTCMGSVRMELVFGNNDVCVFLKKVEETDFGEYNGHLYGVKV